MAEIKFTKVDIGKMQVYGWANWSVTKAGKMVTDLQNDQIPPEVLERAAHNFVLHYGEGRMEHERKSVARLIESVFITDEKLKAMGLKLSDEFKGAGWFVGFKVDDPEVWSKVQAGELAAFSIGGTATIEEIEQ